MTITHGAILGRSRRSIPWSRFVYVDVDGVPLYEVHSGTKDRFAHHWDEDRFTKKGAPAQSARVLYRMVEVSAAAKAGETVWVCQGEPAAEVVRARGVTSTTVLDGRGPWLAQYSRALRGVEVVVCVDSTRPGGEFARLVRDGLGKKATVRIVTPPAEESSVVDHLESGQSLTDLVDVPDAHLEHLLQLGSREEAGVVMAHPTISRLPEPRHPIPWTTGKWAYETGGEHRRERGVYSTVRDEWTLMAPLPYVHARIVTRDQSGGVSSVAHLMSATPDGHQIVIDRLSLQSGDWSERLGLVVPKEDKTQRAVATAITFLADAAPERDSAPRVVDGSISIPCPQTLPAGYLAASGDHDAAMSTFSQMLQVAAESPKLALVMGASAIAPWHAAGREQSHVMALYGDVQGGKTTALQCAAAIWGEADQGIVRQWNGSPIGIMRMLGLVGVLPGFLDELGASDMTAPEMGRFLYNVTNDVRRITAETNGRGGIRSGAPWRGIMFASGNGQLLSGIDAGRFAGLGRRVIEITTPISASRHQVEKLQQFLPDMAGHPGHELLSRFSNDAVNTVRPLLEEAADLVPLDPDAHPHHYAVATLLRYHVAGAAMLDQIAGTGTMLRDAAAIYAREHLAETSTPAHDADRLLQAIREDIAAEPALWPTEDQYATALGGTRDLGRSYSGILANDYRWVGIRRKRLLALAAEVNVDVSVAQRELLARGILQVTETRRKKYGEWTKQIRIKHLNVSLYQLLLPEVDDEDPGAGDSLVPAADEPPAPSPNEVQGVPGDGVVGTGRACSGSVVGAVVGENMRPTGDVVGVVGKPAKTSRTGARATLLPPVEGNRTAAHGQPCALCGGPADWLWKGVPLHYGECRRQWEEGRRSRDDMNWLTRDHGETTTFDTRPTTPAPHLEREHLPTASTPGGHPAADPAPEPTGRRSRAQRPAAGRDRFAAPAAVMDGESIYLPQGQVLPWPQGVRHVGDLALLAVELRLGHGGGTDRRYPSKGQIWLTEGALERLGLPADLGHRRDGQDLSELRESRTAAYAELSETPFVAEALGQGWQLGSGQLQPWTKIWHETHHRSGARIVFLPWLDSEDPAAYGDRPEPAVLAQRLADYANAMGLTWRISSPITALDMVDLARPPRLDADDTVGAGRGRVSVVQGQWAELPPWLSLSSDDRFTNLEADIDWRRGWDQLLDSERSRKFVWAFDRGRSYLAPMASLPLGVEGLRHDQGAAAAWDGSPKPGYFLCDVWEWPHPYLPDPGMSCNGRVDGKVWVTSHTLRQLALCGIHPTVHEAYRWEVTARYLEGPATTWTEALRRTDLDPAVTAMVKETYSRLHGKLQQATPAPAPSRRHLYRPDWGHHLIAASRTGIVAQLLAIQESTGAIPLVVSRDLVAFASDEVDPVAAWPGDPTKFGRATGQWKPVGWAPLQEWGPAALQRSTGHFRYARHVGALRSPSESPRR